MFVKAGDPVYEGHDRRRAQPATTTWWSIATRTKQLTRRVSGKEDAIKITPAHQELTLEYAVEFIEMTSWWKSRPRASACASRYLKEHERKRAARKAHDAASRAGRRPDGGGDVPVGDGRRGHAPARAGRRFEITFWRSAFTARWLILPLAGDARRYRAGWSPATALCTWRGCAGRSRYRLHDRAGADQC